MHPRSAKSRDPRIRSLLLSAMICNASVDAYHKEREIFSLWKYAFGGMLSFLILEGVAFRIEVVLKDNLQPVDFPVEAMMEMFKQ